MRQGKTLRERLLDPLQYDTFLDDLAQEQRGRAAVGRAKLFEEIADDVLPQILSNSDADTELTSLQASVETYPQPCLVVSDAGLIVALNRPAYTAFDLDVSDRIDCCGIATHDGEPLSSKIANLIATPRDGHQTSFCRAYYSDAERPVLLALVPRTDPKSSLKTVLIFFVDIGWDEAIARFLSRAYDLSPAEQEILEMFILGSSLEDIAERRCRSRRTVRTQFYAALAKCGLTSQVDLVREVVAGAMFQSFVPQMANAAKHPNRRGLRILRPGGRTVEVIASGDLSGKPIFMLASLGVQRFSPERTQKFRDAGFCIFAISPPGLGLTDPEPDGADRLSCLAQDVSAVMDQLESTQAPFVCFATNLLSTVQLATKIPNRITQIQSWITIPPARFRTEDEAKQASNPVTAMGNAAMISSAMKNLVTRSSLRAWAILGTRKMAKFQARSEPDIAKRLLLPDNIDAIDEGFKSAIRQGFTKAVVAEAERIHTDWYEDAAKCPVPITLVHGVHDKTNSIESVRAFAQAFADKITLVEIETGGGFLHLTHEDRHVAELKQL